MAREVVSWAITWPLDLDMSEANFLHHLPDPWSNTLLVFAFKLIKVEFL